MPPSVPRRLLTPLLRTALAATALLLARPGAAADKIWKYGGSGTAATAANWVGGVAPVAGDHLVFGSTTPTSPCAWDLAVTVSSVDFAGTWASTVTLSTDLLVSSGVYAASSSSAVLSLAGHQLSVGSDLKADGLVIVSTVTGSSVTFTGATPGTAWKTGAPLSFENAVFNKSAGSSVTVNSGLILKGAFSILGGTAAFNGARVDIGSDLYLNGYMDVRTSTFVFSGSVPQSMGGGVGGGYTSLAGLFVQNPTTTNVAGLPIDVFVATRPSSTVMWFANDAMNVGSLTVQGGSAATRVRLVTDTPGTRAALNVSSATVDLAYVRDLNSSGGPAVNATHSIDAGNNLNWNVNIGGGSFVWKKAGADSLASNAANWAGGVAPSTGDYVTFGSSTPSSACAWDLGVQVASVSVVGAYAAAITLSTDVQSSGGLVLNAAGASLVLAGRALRLGGDLTVGAGTVSGVAGSSVSFEGAASASIVSPSGGAVALPAVAVAKTGAATVAALAPLAVAQDFAVLSGTFTAGAYRHEVRGSLRVTGGYFDVSAGTVALAGSAAQTVSLGAPGQAATVGTFLAQSPSTTTFSAWRVGVLVATTPASSLVFATGASTFTVSTLTVNGQALGTRVGLSGPAALKVVSSADVRYAAASGLDSSAGVNVPALFSLDGGGNVNWTITNVGGSVVAWKGGGGNALASNPANWVGSAAPGAGDYVVFGATAPSTACTWDLSVQLSSLSINAPYAAAVTLSTTLAVSEGLRVDAPSGVLDPAGREVVDSGDWAVRPGGFAGGVAASTVSVYGARDSALTSVGGGPLSFGALRLSKSSSATVRVQSDLIVGGSLETLGGTIDAGSARIDLSRDILIDGGSLLVTRSTLVFSGAAPQATNGNGLGTVSAMAGIFVQNPTTTTIADVAADVFVATRPSATIAFINGGGTAAFGDFTVNGQSTGTRILLVSASPGTPVPIVVNGSPVIDYAYVRDLNAGAGQTLTALHSIDGGGNTNWSISSVGGAKHVWRWAGGSNLASVAANWTDGVVPSTGDYVLFGSSTPAAPCAWDLGVTLASMSFAGAYASTVSLNADLSVSQGVRLEAPLGTLDLHGHAVLDGGDWYAGSTALTASVAGSSVVFQGAGASRAASLIAAPLGFQGLVSSKTAGVPLTLQSDTIVNGDFLIAGGTVAAPGTTLVLAKNLILNGGYFEVSRTTMAFVSLSNAQALTGNGLGTASRFGGINVNTLFDVTLPDLQADVFVATRPSASILLATSASPLTAGRLRIDGQSPSTRVRLASAQSGVQAKLQVLSTATVVNASVQDIDARPGILIRAVDTLDFGNNSSFTFITNGYGIQAAFWSGAFTSSASFYWFSSFPAGTSYLAQVSTGPFPNSFAGNLSSTTFNLSAGFSGLTPNTAYYAHVSTNALSVFTDAGSTVTLAALPASPALTAVHQTSATATWGAAGNPAGTRYDLVASSDSFATVTADSGTYSTTATVTGLAANGTYYLAVSATNGGGVTVMPSAFLTFVTTVAPPSPGAAAAVSSASLTASWSTTDAPGTYYDVQLSTNGYGTLVASARVAAPAASFAALTPNTTYQLRVRALSNAGVPTAYVELATATTLMAAPAPAGVPFPGVGVSSLTAAWTSGGNGAGTVYVAELSTDSFATVSVSSSTQNLTAWFGTGGAGPALTPNQAYAARVKATSGGNTSAYLAVGSTATLPAAPSGAVAAAVLRASGTWTWSSGGNAPGSAYDARLSTDAFATFVQIASTTLTTAAFSGLTANTTYWFEARAVGAGGWTSAYAVAAASATMPSAPAAASYALYASSAHLSWSAADPGALLYAAEASSDAFATLTASSATAGTAADLTGLASNTTYYLRVRALGVSGASSLSASTVAVTLALSPSGPAFTAGGGTTQLVASWGSGGNPGGTPYRAELSTDAFAGVLASSVTTALTATFAGLASDATHYLRVSALNLAGVASTPVSGGSTTTAVAPPAAAAFGTVGASDVVAAWGPSTNGSGTLYEAQVTTGTFPVFNASMRTAALSFDFAGLAVNTTYSFQVRAVGRDGTLTSFVSLGATQTLLLAPGAASPAFVAVGVSSVAVQWTSGGNGAGVLYDADLSTDAFATVSLTSVTASLSALFGTGGLGGALAPNATYYARVRADGGTAQSAYLSLGSTATAAAAPASPAVSGASTSTLSLSWGANGNAAGTPYLAQVSSTSFASVLDSSSTAGLSAAFSGLTPDATYQLRVRAAGVTGPSAFVSVSTWTVPAAPASVVSTAATANSASTMTVSWTGANATGAAYLVQVSSTAFPQVSAQTTTTGTAAALGGLTPNTTYQAQVRALAPDGTGSAFAAAAAVATPPTPPSGLTVFPLPGASTATWVWSADTNGPGVHRLDVSTAPGFATLTVTTTVAVGTTSAVSVSLSGLPSDRQLYSRARVEGWAGPSAYVSLSGPVMFPAIPGSLALSAVTATSASLGWTANGNPGTTQYRAESSTDAFASVRSSVAGLPLTQTFSGLTPNASYYFRVTATGLAGESGYTAVLSTWTPPATPGAAAAPVASVGTSSVAVAWTSGGNPAGTAYRAEVSTDGFSTLVASSVTASLTAAFGTGGVGVLSPDTTYQFRVFASSVSTLSAALSLGATATLAADPVAPAAVASSTGAASLSWGAGGNPSDALYQVQLSTDAFATLVVSAAVSTTSASFGGLRPDTTQYLRVRAVGRDGRATAYAAAAATATYAAAPTAPLVAVTTGAASLSWTTSDPATTAYGAELSTDSFATLNASSQTYAVSALFSGLQANATFYLRVRALGLNGPTAYATAAATATSAAAPAGPVASIVGVSSAALSWSANGNAAGTRYAAEASTDAFASVSQSSVTASLSALFTGLQSNATTYLRVRAVQWNGLGGAYATAAATATGVAPPAAAPLVSVGTGAIVAAWTAGGNSPVTYYDAEISTDAFATVNAAVRTAALQAGFGGLASNAAYDLRVRAVGFDGSLTGYAALPSTTTRLTSPGVPAAPFSAVGVSSATVAWASGGNGAGTVYRADVSTDAFATLVASSVTANLSATFGTGGIGVLRPDTAFSFRVFATSGASLGAAAVLGSTVTLAADPASPAASASSTGTLTLSWSGNGNPADTQYLAALSTDAFATVSRSSAVATTAAAFAALTPDTTYWLEVRAAGRGGTNGAFVLAAATATVAAAPASPAAVFSTAAVALGWSSAGNPAATPYDVQLSTDAFATVNASSQPRGAAASFAGLDPNTTYYLRVRALGTLGPTAFVSAAGATAPLVPGAASAAALGVSSAAASWSAGGNPAGTRYGAEASTDSFATVAQTSATLNLSAAFTGLLADSTYTFRVRALGWSASSSYGAPVSTVTPVAPPSSAPLVAVGTGSVVAAWTSGGNGTGTLYDAQISTDAFATVNASARVAALQAGFGGLLSNTAYDLRARAVGRDGTLTAFAALPSTTTALLPPAASSAPFPAVGVSSLTVAWGGGGNGPGTVYRVQLSSDSFATLVASSDTLNLSAVFGTGGLGTLTTNRAYAARVLSVAGPQLSPLVPLGSTSTLAFGPTATTVLAVTSQTVRLDWSASGNPEPGTSYQLDYDQTGAFSAPTRVAVSTSGAYVSGLAMGATYWFRVRAVSVAGAQTPFDAAVSTTTLPPAPSQPGTPAPAALGVSSLSWTWSAAALASSYDLFADSAASSAFANQPGTTLTQTGLGPNASSFLVVAGVNASGRGPNSGVGLGWTYANPPSAAAASAVHATSATLTWALNGNPAYTGAEVQRSLDGTTYAVVAASAAAVSYTDASLAGCTTYYYRVRNFDGAGRATAFSTAAPFTTANSTPLAPTALSAAPRSGFLVALSWTPSPSADATSYRLYSDGGTGTVDFGAPFAVFTATETSFTTPPLASSAAYAFVLRATNRCGVEEKNTATRALAPALAAPAALAAAVSSPPGGRHVSGNRVTVAAAPIGGRLSALASVRFQYRVSGSGAWTDVAAAAPAHPNPATAAPYYTQWDVTALAAGAYDLRAVAYGLAGSSDAAPVATTVSVDPVTPDLSEVDLGGGRSRRDQAVFASIDNAVVAGGSGAGDPLAKLILPAGALSASTATVSVVSDPDLTAVSTAVADATGAGLFLSVTLSNAQSALAGGRTATLTLSYPDANDDGVVDGVGAAASALRFYSYDPVGGSWRQDLATTFDPSARTVSGATPHFSLFGVFVPAAGSTTLEQARVYPVPYRPDGSNPDQGRPFVAGAAGTGIWFDRLPANARIQIYTVDGRLVADLSAGSANAVQWDARNGAGRDVASGGYFAVIGAPGLRSVVKRLSIVR